MNPNRETVAGVFAAFTNHGDDDATLEAAHTPDIHGEVDRLIAQHLPNEDAAIIKDIAKQIASSILRQIFAFMVEPVVFDKAEAMAKLMPRVCAVLWVLSDEENLKTSNGQRVSLKLMSDALNAIGIRAGKCWLSTIAEEMTNRFGFVSRNQKSRTSRANYAEATRKSWKKRKRAVKSINSKSVLKKCAQKVRKCVSKSETHKLKKMSSKSETHKLKK
jgi:hypothetical protein